MSLGLCGLGKRIGRGDEGLQLVEMGCWTVKLSLRATLGALLDEDVKNDWNVSIIFGTMCTNSHTLIRVSLTNIRPVIYHVKSHCCWSVLDQHLQNWKQQSRNRHPCERAKWNKEYHRFTIYLLNIVIVNKVLFAPFFSFTCIVLHDVFHDLAQLSWLKSRKRYMIDCSLYVYFFCFFFLVVL